MRNDDRLERCLTPGGSVRHGRLQKLMCKPHVPKLEDIRVFWDFCESIIDVLPKDCLFYDYVFLLLSVCPNLVYGILKVISDVSSLDTTTSRAGEKSSSHASVEKRTRHQMDSVIMCGHPKKKEATNKAWCKVTPLE